MTCIQPILDNVKPDSTRKVSVSINKKIKMFPVQHHAISMPCFLFVFVGYDFIYIHIKQKVK